DFTPKPTPPFARTFRYQLIWPSREGGVPEHSDDERRARFAAALTAEIMRLREQHPGKRLPRRVKELASVLAAIDGRNAAAAVIGVIAMPGEWDEFTALDAAEKLLMVGVVLPAEMVFALLDSFLNRAKKSMQDSDKHLLGRLLALCPFVDDPSA